MSIRDEELKRLEAYAKSLGIPVSYRKLKKEYSGAAEFYIDGSQIIVYTWPGLSKTQMVINLLHELGHAVHWIHTGKQTPKELIEALIREGERKHPTVLDKADRRLIYEDEHQATHYWDNIVKQVDIRINPNVILLRKKLDVFAYRFYYETGDFPSDKQLREKKKEYINEQQKSKKRK